MLRSSVEVPSADQLRRDLQLRANTAKEEIKKELERINKVSIALDAWSSPNHKSFLAVIAYYITDNYQYEFALIGFEEIHGRHTGENLAKLLYEILKEYNLERILFAITTDNAGNNYTMTTDLQFELRYVHSEWDSTVMHIPCLAHVVQLVVKAFLDGIKVTARNEALDKAISDDDLEDIRKLDKSFNRTLQMVRYLYI